MHPTVIQADFDALVANTHAQVRAYIAGMGIPLHEVDDIAQEVYVAVYKDMQGVPQDIEPIRWLKGIARNLCLNHIRTCNRKSRLHMKAVTDILQQTETAWEERTGLENTSQALRNCMEKLASQSRRLLQMRYKDGLTSEEIAQALAMTAEAVRVHLFRMNGKLKECIERSLAHEP